jgi:hypothetical protein
MNKLPLKCFTFVILIYNSVSFAQNFEIKEVTKINREDVKNEFEARNNYILFCSIYNITDFIDSTKNKVSLNQKQVFIKLKDLSIFEIYEIDVTNAILIKLPYELNQQLIQKTLPLGWTSKKTSNENDFIYSIQRATSGQCSKEEKLTLFKDTYLKCLELILKSEKSTEYLTYKSKELIQVNDLSNKKLDLLNIRIDSLEELITEQHQTANLKNNSKNILCIDYSNSIHGWGKIKNNYLLEKINVSSIGINWLFLASEKIYIGFGLSHFKYQFNSSFKYDSVNYSSQTDIGIPYVKSIITRDLSEVNSFNGNSILINFRFSNNLNKNIHVDMNMNLSYSPKFNITSKVSSGTTDYVGYLTTINEPLSNLSDLGLKSGVSMVNLEDQNYYSSFGMIMQPTIGYETQIFYSRIGFSFSLMQYRQISNMELSTTSRIGDYHSSISQIGNFNLNTLNLSLTVGIRL